MKIASILINGQVPIDRWCEHISCKSWDKKLRLWIIKSLIKSLYKSQNISYIRVDTGSNSFTMRLE